MNTMKKAHEIRKAAAAKWNCKVSEISFSHCLKMAWAGEELETNRIETAQKIAEKFAGRVWAPKGEEGIIRVYLAKRGFCQVEENGVNVDSVNRNQYTEVKDLCAKINVASFRA